jgi:hypothetical protein
LKKKDLPAQEIEQLQMPRVELHPYPGWDGGTFMWCPVFLPSRSVPRSNSRLSDLLSSFYLSSNARVRKSAGILTPFPTPLFASRLVQLKIPAPSDYAVGVFLIAPRMKRARNN